MSDNPAIGFAIGSLAAGRGANELAELCASIMTPRPIGNVGLGADIKVLVQAIQEQEQHIARQNDAIDRLRRNVVAWQEYAAKVEAKRDRLQEYAKWAEAELKKVSGQI